MAPSATRHAPSNLLSRTHMSRLAHHIAIIIVLLLGSVQQALTQWNAAPCPYWVDHRVIGYPDGYVDYDDGYRSGVFYLEYLYDPIGNVGGLNIGRASYWTEPDLPRDRDNRNLVWDNAAIDCSCTIRHSPIGEQFTVVQELPFGKRGAVMLIGDDRPGGLNQPTDTDTWEEWIDGIRFTCTGTTEDDGTRVVTCTADS